MQQKHAEKYEELWNEIKYLTRSITNNSDIYVEKYMKIKFHWNKNSPLKKTLELYDMVTVVISVFHVGSKYYPQIFLYEYLYKL